MQTLFIHAASRESALGIHTALVGFRMHPIEGDDGYRVAIELPGGDRDIVDVLGALAQHVRERDDGPAQLELEGRTYSVYPAD
ncbi:MAG TPA: hypothetical protein VI142_08835 [Gaiellaceae bacterium]